MADGKIVWILGAGFSRSLGAPLLVDLFTPEAGRRVAAHYQLNGDPNHRTGPAWVAQVCSAGIRGKGIENQWDHAEEFLERLELAETSEVARKVLADFMGLVGSPRDNPGRREIAGRYMQQAAFKQFRSEALQFLAAEICCFLEGADLLQEEWQPYVRWARELRPWDTVITFNYDWVPELLLGAQGQEPRLEILDPAMPSSRERLTSVYKLHGSANWVDAGRGTAQVSERTAANAMSWAHQRKLVIATPGREKRTMVEGGSLAKLWEGAGFRIAEADAIVFVGYRIPPSDAQSRSWLAERIAAAERSREAALKSHTSSGWTRFHTILGPNVQHHDSQRLAGLLESLFLLTKNPVAVRQRIKQWPMGAEDFLSVVSRSDLLP